VTNANITVITKVIIFRTLNVSGLQGSSSSSSSSMMGAAWSYASQVCNSKHN